MLQVRRQRIFHGATLLVIGIVAEILFLCPLLNASTSKADNAPSHLMVGPGIFNVDEPIPLHVPDRVSMGGSLPPYKASCCLLCQHRPIILYLRRYCLRYFYRQAIRRQAKLCTRLVSPRKWKETGVPYQLPLRDRGCYRSRKQREGSELSSAISLTQSVLRNPGADSLVFYYGIPVFGPKKKKPQS